jgi:DNA recombination protein RmuC
MEIVLLIIGLIVGAVLGFMFAKVNKKESGDLPQMAKDLLTQKDTELLNLKSVISNLENVKLDLSVAKEGLSAEKTMLAERVVKFEQEVDLLRKNLNSEKERATTLQEKQQNLEESLVNQKKELLEVQEKFTKEFENIANKVLDAKAEKFNEQSKEKLGEILVPFQEKINNFKEEVEKSSYKSTQERIELKEHIKQLSMLNETMQKETQSLTLALKQDSKAQGNWGEVILERVLESSGLTKDREYFTQLTFTSEEDDKMMRPDVVVKLPDNKNVIIDAKVSLTAYNQLINAENDTDREIAMKAHLVSIKSHINNLAGKNYQFAEGIDTPDFVLLFMPIESSFSIATQADNDLFNYAWSKKIVIVSPSTLLATLRTIASVWKHEYQNKNAMEIADRAAKMYDKFVGFVADMQSIGSNIQKSEKAYTEAMKKLSDGSGNLIGMAQKVVDLGAKPKKALPQNLLEGED